MQHKAVISVNQEEVTLRVPTGRFTDTIISDWSISTHKGTKSGKLDVKPWSKQRIKDFDKRLARHNSLGKHLKALHQRLDHSNGVRMKNNWSNGKKLPDTMIDWRIKLADFLDKKFAITKPGDNSVFIRNCSVDMLPSSNG